ncbi:hypothetical protein CLOM_g23762 [Closterium sp. NIES-68]|nr:hypothetical protein CLOM_g23762 [Closterium sp. NIES-68]GJP70787.1 hypothetical protein CLOP_g1690 [Closterium sp. NIES-67]
MLPSEASGGPVVSAHSDHVFKLLLVGDSGVGKSCLLLRFTSDTYDDMTPTIGVDFKIKSVIVNGKRVNLTIWDTAGQERFRTLTSSYYRGASGVILVYDVTRKETFASLSDVWVAEVQQYSTLPGCVLMLVGNKADRESDRQVGKEQGVDLARSWGCLFLECSAKTRLNVQQCFSELVHKIMEDPTLVDPALAHAHLPKNLQPRQGDSEGLGSCSC